MASHTNPPQHPPRDRLELHVAGPLVDGADLKSEVAPRPRDRVEREAATVCEAQPPAADRAESRVSSGAHTDFHRADDSAPTRPSRAHPAHQDPPPCPACGSTRYGWIDGGACACGDCGEPLEAGGAPAWLAWPRTKLERRFADFHRGNPHILAEFERRALQLHAAGARRIGAKAIAERIRWDIHIRTLGDEYKLNNSFVALYSRLLIHRHPALADVIETRTRKECAA